MIEIERILDQLKRAFEGSAWHGPSVHEALEGITAEQAHPRTLQNAHSIWELAHHIAVWENAVRRRLVRGCLNQDLVSLSWKACQRFMSHCTGLFSTTSIIPDRFRC